MSAACTIASPIRIRGAFDIRKFLPFRLSVLSNRLTRAVQRIASTQFGLATAEWRIIALLAQNGPMTGSLLVELTTMDKVRVSRTLIKLLQNDHIARETDPNDRRRATVSLTPKGLLVYQQIVPLMEELEDRIMACLTHDERAYFDTALSKFETYIKENSGDDGRDAADILIHANDAS